MTLLIAIIASFVVSFVLGCGIGKFLKYASDEHDKRS